MTLVPGTKLGVYEVLSSLGAGGMGEVYRARDTKLNRDVALKVLPEAFAADAQRMGRFEREAQLLASMNHPNIAAIYGLEESGSVRALVMELVEGHTLAERMAVGEHLHGAPVSASGATPVSGPTREGRKGAPLSASVASPASGLTREGLKGPPLPVDEALPIAKQIAEALEYAHERGIIHRDLKPANIKITPEGTVKVLDFGLAKALDSTISGASQGPGAVYDSPLQNSPTLTSLATQAGVIIGTAAYMSPEQARGKNVDRRADIWAFGCVLYEMFSARRLFGGETVSDTLAAVIMKEPDWDALPATVPALIQKLIRRCLTKDPKQRLRDIGEARITIEETISGADAVAALSSAPTAAGTLPLQPETERLSPLRRALPWGVASMAVVLAGIFAAAFFIKTPPAAAPIRALIMPPDKGSFAFSYPSGAPVLSPDGTRLVFPATDASGKEGLWVRPLGSLTSQRLEGTEGAEFPFWSPDSRFAGFFQTDKLKKIDVTGGPPVLICDAPGARGGAWSANDVIVFAPHITNGGLSSVPAAGGAPAPIAAPKGSGGAFSNRWPVFLPDGKHFIFLSGDLAATGTSKLGIYLGEIGSNEDKFLLQADSDALYSPPGYLLFLRGDTLMAQAFDAGRLKLGGEAFPVAEHVSSPQLFRLGLFSVSQTGLLVYENGQAGGGGGQLTWFDASGKELGAVGQPGAEWPHLSPDGKRVAYAETGPGSNGRDIWLMDLERGVRTRFTFGPTSNRSPVWSPDGSRIAYASVQQGNYEIYVKSASGAGTGQPLLKSEDDNYPVDWSRDGRYLSFVRVSAKGKGKAETWMLPLFSDRKPFAYLQMQFDVGSAVFSPDGHWLAYDSDESGTDEIYLSPFPGGGGKWQVSQGGGVQPQWNHDGSALYYLAPGGKFMEASIKENGSAVEIGTPKQLFQAAVAGQVAGAHTYSVSPDGKRFLINKAQSGVSPPLTLVANWTSGLKK